MTSIRILHRDPAGKVSDGGIEFGLEQCPPGADDRRHDPRPRRAAGAGSAHAAERVDLDGGRVFNPRDQEDTVALIVESRDGNLADEAFA